MNRKIFVNLPVKDLRKSVEYYQGLGFGLHPKFTDDTAACIVISDDIYVMAITHAKFREFTTRTISDSAKSTEVLVAISAESRAEVDEFATRAVAMGGKIHRKPEDHGWMYGQSVEDLDGHIWEMFWMDESQIQ